jgi:two-component system, OmpR family, sensor histidine kinase KdpD
LLRRKALITISAERRGESIAVSVAGRGDGIDPLEQILIFERFYRSKSHGEGTAGTGMGLPISRAIIEAHGGKWGVISQPGQGSVFTFTLPAISGGQ